MQWICLHNLAIHDEKRHFKDFLSIASKYCLQQNNIQYSELHLLTWKLNTPFIIILIHKRYSHQDLGSRSGDDICCTRLERRSTVFSEDSTCVDGAIETAL